MDQQKFEKSVKTARNFAIGLAILSLISIFILPNSLNIILNTIVILLVIVATIGFNKKEIYAPICGIIICSLLILSLNIINIIFGLLYLIDCIKILNGMNQNKNINLKQENINNSDQNSSDL